MYTSPFASLKINYRKICLPLPRVSVSQNAFVDPHICLWIAIVTIQIHCKQSSVKRPAIAIFKNLSFSQEKLG